MSGGGTPRKIQTGYGHCTEPNWSPDGRRIAFNVRKGRSSRVAVFDFQSKRTRVLEAGEDPCWGPDSQHVVYSTGKTLVILNVDTGEKRTVVKGLGKVSEPSWSR